MSEDALSYNITLLEFSDVEPIKARSMVQAGVERTLMRLAERFADEDSVEYPMDIVVRVVLFYEDGRRIMEFKETLRGMSNDVSEMMRKAIFQALEQLVLNLLNDSVWSVPCFVEAIDGSSL